MKMSTKITNIQRTTPMVSTKTRTASVSGGLDLFICNSRGKKKKTPMIITTGSGWEKEGRNGYLNENFISEKQF